MALYSHCHGAFSTATITFDVLMMVIAILCMIITTYGIYKYRRSWKNQPEDYRPPVYLHRVGFLLFALSWFTVLNALIYDILHATCSEWDHFQGELYHMLYFCQIYTLWLYLFLRVYFVFRDSLFSLSKPVLYAYSAVFLLIVLLMVPMYVVLSWRANIYLALPYAVLSIVFSTSLLFTFLSKLLHIFVDVGADEALLRTATRNALLAAISIGCSLLVIFVLIGRIIYDHGFHEHHNIAEELIFEGAVLIDIVSNFVCVVLTYSFFGEHYYRLCGALDQKFAKCVKKYVSRQMLRNHAGTHEKTMVEIVAANESTNGKTAALTVTISSTTSSSSSSKSPKPKPKPTWTAVVHPAEFHSTAITMPPASHDTQPSLLINIPPPTPTPAVPALDRVLSGSNRSSPGIAGSRKASPKKVSPKRVSPKRETPKQTSMREKKEALMDGESRFVFIAEQKPTADV